MSSLRRIAVLFCTLAVLPAHAGLEEIRAAAERGDAKRQFELGELYEFGFGMPQSRVPALAWYIVAADAGHTVAAQRRDMLKQQLTQDQVAAAEREAASLKTAIAARRDRPAAEPAEPTATPATPAGAPTAPPAAPAAPAAAPAAPRAP